jgi:osmotically-inducible protein OsmY
MIMTLEQQILDALSWEPNVDRERLWVAVGMSGLVTLHGVVHTYSDKCAVEEAVLRVPGVTGVRNALEVRLTIGDYRPDTTLERVLREMIDALARMPAERPRVTVSHGWVTLEGTVSHAFQKQLVANAVREVAGVVGITNRIAIEKERRTERPPLSCAIS